MKKDINLEDILGRLSKAGKPVEILIKAYPYGLEVNSTAEVEITGVILHLAALKSVLCEGEAGAPSGEVRLALHTAARVAQEAGLERDFQEYIQKFFDDRLGSNLEALIKEEALRDISKEDFKEIYGIIRSLLYIPEDLDDFISTPSGWQREEREEESSPRAKKSSPMKEEVWDDIVIIKEGQ